MRETEREKERETDRQTDTERQRKESEMLPWVQLCPVIGSVGFVQSV